MSEHIVPVRVYITIFLALLLGTALTVAAAFFNFPWQLNTIVALTIATIKATLVVLYFMRESVDFVRICDKSHNCTCLIEPQMSDLLSAAQPGSITSRLSVAYKTLNFRSTLFQQ